MLTPLLFGAGAGIAICIALIILVSMVFYQPGTSDTKMAALVYAIAISIAFIISVSAITVQWQELNPGTKIVAETKEGAN